MQYFVVCCSMVRCVAVCVVVRDDRRLCHCLRCVRDCNTLQHTATHCNTLQHTATHCNTLQHTATHCDALRRQPAVSWRQVCWCVSAMQRDALCHSVVRYVALFCSALKCAVCCSVIVSGMCNYFSLKEGFQTLHFFLCNCVKCNNAVCCSALQCVAVRCSVLQCVAVCCSELQ